MTKRRGRLLKRRKHPPAQAQSTAQSAAQSPAQSRPQSTAQSQSPESTAQAQAQPPSPQPRLQSRGSPIVFGGICECGSGSAVRADRGRALRVPQDPQIRLLLLLV
eukprot:CAMPEP_0171777358 /NCGR_PEP_ID=MMETSP0991-20121206/57740_1 /TAXON_ID=483369 /ORGANISM="non described non described, Strain CCMP2098" /LENGTH=105 /DNA_ID=CAMNT_0012384069 /DNA_START=111 /DNA_END=424 /DNA_ORIENTATION=+